MNFRKKAQEEMVGFVLIVIIVSVIAIIILGISLSRPRNTEAQTSAELDSFSSAILSYTTNCEIPETNPRQVRELIKDCKQNDVCSNGQSPCQVLETTLKELVKHSSYVVEKESYTRYLKISVLNEVANGTYNDAIPPVKEGNEQECSRKLIDTQPLNIGLAENSIFKVEVCYKD
ncbi:hypothetical protein COU56_02870 [Candidatus Pacearchaeota archaeon CG10_big_fil_rev_8_21_14_0_10_31_9]|nr:MAG: hypothetical protein AUJ62_01145 [Candidatus Pacearchaeota archaeon CG1_02_32_21]PIN94213.1 MAG: hypothetical protein COU56_02870 [Candidatus Pacearchaeota archaeon CG10_big_fil_rev_8_21_14_0_10_31_9]PIZ83250.1 MAG: hypothetical protein COX97_01435 [Candidatus Pacearchaeota archaeon CG_4_10_14_0_2_um_filter_05_32_18]